MPATVVVGTQWGDEGKGKLTDLLARDMDFVVRYQGGHNAGHRIVVEGREFALQLVPSGILYPGVTPVIGNGVVVDPAVLLAELDTLLERDVDVSRLVVSGNAHLIMPYHQELDRLTERFLGKNALGTTKRGIGPAYGDKAARVGLRMNDLIDPKRLAVKLAQRIKENNGVLKALGAKPISYKKVLAEYTQAGKYLKPFVANTVIILHNAMRNHADILFEGAQGTFLDIDHGTYPFVTSSSTTSGGACTGSGVPPHRMDRVVGVLKAYTTRVGEGPLPTENKEVADLLHGMGREFGATTGRARRCGWFDSVATRHATMVNGIDDLAVTNLDGLDTVETIKVCVAYRHGRKQYDFVPNDAQVLAECKPVYVEFEGWLEDTSKATAWKELPVKARNYLKAIAELSNAKLFIASVGPARSQTIFV